ncbi:MAG: hypothetical protein AAF581_08415 [Planctomycetota bacterium]
MSNKINFGVLWEKHKKFLLTVFGGFALFLGLQTFAASYRDGANATFDRSQKKVGGLVRAAEELDKVYGPTLGEQRVIGDHIEGFLDKVGLSRTSRIKIPEDLNRAATDFPAKFGKVWDNFTDEADKIHLRYPDKSKVRFDLRGNLSKFEWADRYRKLEVTQRVLQAAHELRLNEILEISPRPTMIEEIPDSKQVAVRYPVAVKIRAPFAKVCRLFDYFQRDTVYLTVELDVTSKDGGDILTGDLLFSGVDIEKPRDSKKSRKRGGW